MLPIENDLKLIEGPSIIDPTQIWSIGSIVIIGVYPFADDIEANPHKMSIDIAEDNKFKNEIDGVDSNVKLRCPL